MKSVRLQQSPKKIQPGQWGVLEPSPQQKGSQGGQEWALVPLLCCYTDWTSQCEAWLWTKNRVTDPQDSSWVP